MEASERAEKEGQRRRSRQERVVGGSKRGLKGLNKYYLRKGFVLLSSMKHTQKDFLLHTHTRL